MMATAKNKLSTDFQSAINCVPERSLLGAFGKQHHDYDHDVFNSAGSTLATPHFGPENGVHLSPDLGVLSESFGLRWTVLGSALGCVLAWLWAQERRHRLATLLERDHLSEARAEATMRS